MREWINFYPKNNEVFRKKVIDYTYKVKTAIILTNSNFLNEKKYKKYSKFNFLAGIDKVAEVTNLLKNNNKIINDWYFGFFNYNFNNISSNKSATVNFPNSYFFQPKWLIKEDNSQWKIGFLKSISDKNEALSLIDIIETYKDEKRITQSKIKIEQSLSEEAYLEKFAQIKSHISNNNLSAINLAIEFYANNSVLNPTLSFHKLNKLSPMPFSSFVKLDNNYALVFSPERYLQKTSNKIVTMPMKGTARKSNNNEENIKILSNMLSSQKERAENITTVEEIRKQLLSISSQTSINTEELCSGYDFPNIFQMVSTLSAELMSDKTWFDAIISTFPMGSMTGVPKTKAIDLIEQFEPNNRSLFSGSIGYITPNKDFDFNVVIRSLFYDEKNKKLSFWAGSAITSSSVGEDEYKECLTKSSIIKKYLTD